ncbi:MAG: hypothetical protein KO202_05475 [Methanobacteriaceae archaeon]|jgi:hypothetical protein|nr:hypothetical protein [Methanobacteriaceae archaeon]
MGIMELIAILILIFAVLILIYYYLQSNPLAADKIKSYMPSSHSVGALTPNNIHYNSNNIEDDELEDKTSMGKKIKVKLSDIDMSSFNTDAFSKKIDAFLDEKSDELIQDWELATKTDLKDLEDKFKTTTKSVDDLEKKFDDFKEDSNNKFDDFEKRIKILEEN